MKVAFISIINFKFPAFISLRKTITETLRKRKVKESLVTSISLDHGNIRLYLCVSCRSMCSFLTRGQPLVRSRCPDPRIFWTALRSTGWIWGTLTRGKFYGKATKICPFPTLSMRPRFPRRSSSAVPFPEKSTFLVWKPWKSSGFANASCSRIESWRIGISSLASSSLTRPILGRAWSRLRLNLRWCPPECSVGK